MVKNKKGSKFIITEAKEASPKNKYPKKPKKRQISSSSSSSDDDDIIQIVEVPILQLASVDVSKSTTLEPQPGELTEEWKSDEVRFIYIRKIN